MLYTINSEIIARVLFSRNFANAIRSFVKISPSRNCDITLSFTNGGKSCPNREFLTSQICLLTLFAKIKFLRKFPNLQYLALYCVMRPLGILPLYNYNRSLDLSLSFRAPKTMFNTFFFKSNFGS